MSVNRSDLARPAQFSFDEVFAILAKSSFIPVSGDWVIMLTNRSQTLQVEGEDQTMLVSYEATLYKRGDVSKPTWHGPSMDPYKHRYYQIDPKNPDSHTYDAVSDPKVAIDPADPKTLCLMTHTGGDGWVTTIMRPQTVNGLARLAELISGRVPLELFLHIVGLRTHFSVKETLEIVHQLDVAMREAYGVGPKERAVRMRIMDQPGGLYGSSGDVAPRVIIGYDTGTEDGVVSTAHSTGVVVEDTRTDEELAERAEAEQLEYLEQRGEVR